jgi:hypothetical protein
MANDPKQTKNKETQEKLTKLTEDLQEKKAPGVHVFRIGTIVFDWTLTFMKIGSGIGLLKMQSWARWLAIAYAVLSLLLKVVVVIFSFAFLNPVAQEAFEQLPAANRQPIQPIMDFASAFAHVVPFIMMIYPFAILVVMLLPSVARAFRPRDLDGDFDERAENEDYRDDDRREDPY